MATVTDRRAPSGLFVVIGAGGEIFAGGPRPFAVISNRDELRAWAAGRSWRHVWMTEGGAKFLEFPARRRGWVEIDGIKFRHAGWEAGSPFSGVEDPADLFRALWKLESALGGVGWFQSGAITSDVLLRSLHRAPRARAIGRTVLPAPAIKPGKGARAPGGESPFMWHRPPRELDRGGWVHHFDLNGAYLAAASKLRLPQGDPIRWGEAGEIDPATVPGYWLVRPDPWDLDIWPAPWGNRPGREGPEKWVTTPTLRLLRDIDWRFDLLDGWLWLDTCEALTPWYERLRDARKQLSGPAREAIKQIYRQGIGRLGSDNRTNLEDPLYQPAWAHHVIAESRARVFRRFTQLARYPLAVEVDSVWIQHEEEDPELAAKELRLPIGDGLGEWKPLGRLEAIAAASVLCGPPRGVFARFRELEAAASG